MITYSSKRSFTFYLIAIVPLLVAVDGFLINTNQGLIRGIEEKTLNGKTYQAYLGIPFAKPPIGILRFKDPVAPEVWEGIFEANDMPDYCIQKSAVQQNLGNDPYVGKEDCLYLNMYVPKGGRINLPVMVYFHGGAFYRGGAKEYGPKTLLDEDIILIITQYRLGAFGFLSTGDSVVPGNFGLKDQTMALKWVQENVGKFGGNPNKVTIFGQSAGGASVHYHLLSSWSKGLFQRAIIQSGTSLCPWAQSSYHRQFAEELGQQFKCPIQDGNQSYLECMQTIDSHELLKYVSDSVKFYISPNWMTPRVDGDFLTKSPEVLLREGNYTKVNILSGIVKDEGAAALTSLGVLLGNLEKLRATSLVFNEEENGTSLATQVFSRYFGNKSIGTETYQEFVEMISDRYFMVCHQVAARFHVASHKFDTYLYEFDYKPASSPFDEISEMYHDWIVHAEELGLLFNGFGIFSRPMNGEEDIKMKRLLVKFWTNFAKTGNPTPDDSLGFLWPPSSTDLRYLLLSTSPQMKENSRQNTVDWWNSLPLRQNKLLFPNSQPRSDEL